MKSLELSSFGAPTDVVELAEVDPADPGPGQLAVSIEAAPINPSDLNLIRGIYGVRPDLPAALGAEGVGRVVAVGDGVDPSRVGTRVLIVPTLEQATWREQSVLDERNAVPVDPDGDPLQLAMLGINPITAYCLLHGYVKLAPGAWVAQTGASSATAGYVLALAKHPGYARSTWCDGQNLSSHCWTPEPMSCSSRARISPSRPPTRSAKRPSS